ncbi:cysteine-rich receptor protein kinase [Trifolium repens]|nr:cysteine-rich receptor protein kinase [Trifolium repens]
MPMCQVVLPETLDGKSFDFPAVLCGRYSDEEFFYIRYKEIVGVCFISKRLWKKRDSAQEPKTETDINTVESLRFDLSALEEATNKFSEANKLGEGGFGEVYKGSLPSG